jgi:hypothetical protein
MYGMCVFKCGYFFLGLQYKICPIFIAKYKKHCTLYSFHYNTMTTYCTVQHYNVLCLTGFNLLPQVFTAKKMNVVFASQSNLAKRSYLSVETNCEKSKEGQ